MVLDHLCRNTRCVNPKHLEAVTQKENILRGIGISAQNAVKTHCWRGHPFKESNMFIYKNQRHCLACGRIIGKKMRDRKRLLILPEIKESLELKRKRLMLMNKGFINKKLRKEYTKNGKSISYEVISSNKYSTLVSIINALIELKEK